MNVSGVTALITGANRGIGQQLVLALLQAGCTKVYATARQRSSLMETVAFAPDRVVPLTLDVTSSVEIAQAVSDASDTTLLINNAGILKFGDALAISPPILREHMDVNVYGLFAVSQAFVNVIKKNGRGALVNILSDIAFNNAPEIAGYSASKATAWSLTQSLRVALQPGGIEVYAVFPGPVATAMLAQMHIPKASPLDVAKTIVEKINAGQRDIFPDALSRRFESPQIF